jgi:hypothetical protein
LDQVQALSFSRGCLDQARRMIRMEQESEQAFASKVLEAIRKDGKVKTAILDLVCACSNVVTEY